MKSGSELVPKDFPLRVEISSRSGCVSHGGPLGSQLTLLFNYDSMTWKYPSHKLLSCLERCENVGIGSSMRMSWKELKSH